MLDSFCIFTKGGALLWTIQLAALRGDPVNALIRTCLLEERRGESSFSYTPPTGGAYTMKWTLHNVRSSWACPFIDSGLPWHSACSCRVWDLFLWLYISEH